MGAWEQMEADYAVLGLSARYHPLGLLRSRLPAHYVTTTDIETLPNGRVIEIAGLIVCRQRPGTAKGVQFLLLEDEVGLVNVVVQPWLYEKRRLTVRGEPFLVITGEIQHQGGAINVVARDVIPLEQARQALRRHLVRDDRDAIRPHPEDPVATSDNTNSISPASHNYY